MLTRLGDHLAIHPSGWVAHVFAVTVVAIPLITNSLFRNTELPLGDTIPVVATVVRLYSNGDRDLAGHCSLPREGRWAGLSSPDKEPYWVRHGRDGAGRYSAYPAGMEVFAWPAVLIAASLGKPIERDYCQFVIEQEVSEFVGGLCLGLFFLAGLCIARVGPVFVATLLLATGSVITTTLTQLLWQQTGVVCWILVVLLVELRCRGQVGRSGTLIQAIACSLMFACRPSAVTFLMPFGLWVLARDLRRGVILPALSLAFFAPWAAMYHSIYGNFFGPGMIGLEVKWTPFANIGGVLFSPGRGLLVYQPWMWLLPLLCSHGVRDVLVRPLPAAWYLFCITVIACHVLVVGSWPVWWGGCCWGSRLSAEVIPIAGLLTLPPIAWLMARRWGWFVLAIVAAAGVMVQLPYLYGDAAWWNSEANIDAQPEHLWDWRNPPFLYRYPS